VYVCAPPQMALPESDIPVLTLQLRLRRPWERR
jgi:hypothetical protein